MIFTPEQVAHYRDQGFIVFPRLFDAREVEAMKVELYRCLREGKARNVTTEGDGKTHTQKEQNLQLIPLHDKSTLFRAVPFHPKLLAAVTQLLGEPAIMHLDQIFLKPARHGRGTNWHQDNHYFRIADPMMGIGTWTALHDASAANGTMHVIPGLWRVALEHKRDPFSDHHMHCEAPEEKAVPVEIPAGSVLFFCYGLPHCTKANTTDSDRAGLAVHFLREDYAPHDLIAPGRDCRPLVNGPRSTGGEQEYGVRVAGTWELEVGNILPGWGGWAPGLA